MISAIIVGAGHRALFYASLAKKSPDKLKIIGVADPVKSRQKKVAEMYGFSNDFCFNSAEELARQGKIADAIINGTMDKQHVETTIPLLDAGYDVLLEKPFAVSRDEVKLLADTVERTGRKVMICHVLRYAPFYSEIKQRCINGEIGDIINVQTAEHVSYHHMACCFVRGKWRRKDDCGSSSLMSKCCHDLDILAWIKSGIKPKQVSSFGGLYYFCKENAPTGSGQYCLLDCPLEKECLYSARKHYLDHPERWEFYVWAALEDAKEISLEQKEEFLKDKSNPYSKCVWKLDNNVVDRQSLMIEFNDGSIATHNMICGTSRPMRKIHIIGTKGEIHGIMDDNKYVVRHIDPRSGHEYKEIEYDLNDEGDTTGAFGGHGGGDIRLVEDFVDVLEGASPSISCTSLDDSLSGHLIGFLADQSMDEQRTIAY